MCVPGGHLWAAPSDTLGGTVCDTSSSQLPPKTPGRGRDAQTCLSPQLWYPVVVEAL